MADESPSGVENRSKSLQLFRAALSAIFQEISDSVSVDEFADTWTVMKKKRKTSQLVYNGMKKTMYENMVSRMDEFIAEDEVADKLDRLEKLAEESDTSPDHVAWRPPGNVDEHLRSLDGTKIREHKEKLQEYVANIEAENQKLLNKVSKGRTAANRVGLSADRLLNQQKRVRSEFENTARRIESDIKRLRG